MDECPICFKRFPVKDYESHVNSCLDSQEASQPSTTSDPDVVVSGISNRNPFAVLGLKMNKKKSSSKEKQSRPLQSLASMIVAEKKRSFKSINDNDVPPSRRSSEVEIKIESNKKAKIVSNDHEPGELLADSQSQPVNVVLSPEPLSKESKEPSMLSKDSTYEDIAKLKREAHIPLAQRLRPDSLDDFFGQEKLIGPNGILRNMIEADNIPSTILWGLPGVGKTTLARIISKMTKSKFIEVSAVETNTKHLKEIFSNAENEKRLTNRRTIVFVDEIHRFNKAVQDLFLPVLEKGTITVIGATTENPSFTLRNALLSRMHTFTLEPLNLEAEVKVILRGLRLLNRTRILVHKLHLIDLNKESVDYIANLSSGDSRVALNILESIHAYLSGVKYSQFEHYEDAERNIKIPEKVGVIKITLENIKPLLSTRNYHEMYDKIGDSHYDSISAFHKSVRGSDPDAAMFYLVKMLSGGEDPMFIIRRMIVIASEDIGLRDHSCLPFMVAAKEAVEFVGMPEAEIILAHCASKLARAPKSTKSYRALRSTQKYFEDHPDARTLPIPLHLRNAPTELMKELGYGKNYKYNPKFKMGKVKQSYLPQQLIDENVKFYDHENFLESKDPELDPELLQTAGKEEEDYEHFKELRKKIIESERIGYDEFLSKIDQPQFFDGTEQDHYSDDPNCSHNFDHSYDENLLKEDQPHYFDEYQGDSLHYEPEYPVLQYGD